MSFKNFNDEGPGTFSWDYVLGGNTTGLFPEETHWVLQPQNALYWHRTFFDWLDRWMH